MPYIRLTKEEALDILYEENDKSEIILDEIMDTDRWSIHKRLIFKLNGRFYETSYSVGATEQQDESPFEYDECVSCMEVEPYEVTVIDYRPVK